MRGETWTRRGRTTGKVPSRKVTQDFREGRNTNRRVLQRPRETPSPAAQVQSPRDADPGLASSAQGWRSGTCRDPRRRLG